MKLRVVCRGSTSDGLGHLFRTRTFASEALKGHDVEVVAVAQEALVPDLGRLPCDIQFVDTEDGALDLISDKRVDVLICDAAYLREDVVLAGKEFASFTVSISPVFDQMHHMDAVFTRSPDMAAPAGVRVFGGLEYAIFSNRALVIGDVVYRNTLAQPELPIAVCMGGGDAANKTLRILKALMQLDFGSTLWALLGEGYTHSYDQLVDCIRHDRRHEIILAKTNRSMWHIMGGCAVAVLAGGLTTVEAVYAGLPTINVFEKQEHMDAMTVELFDRGVCVNGGLLSEDSLQILATRLAELNGDRERLWDMHRNCHGLVDMRGSERVLRVLSQLLKKQ